MRIAGFILILILIFITLVPAKVASEEPSDARETQEVLESNEIEASRDGQRSELEKQLEELEKQIAEQQVKVEGYQKQGKTLKNEINAANAKISKLNLQIKAINLALDKLNHEINETQRKINRTENKIENHKDAISSSLRRLYEADNQSLLSTLVAHSQLSDFFGNLSNIILVQDNLRVSLSQVVKLREELLEQKQELAIEKEDSENLKAVQQTQKRKAEVLQAEKTGLLKVTKGKESEYKRILAKTKETAAQVRSRIFELLGGGELTFGKAYEFAKLAEGATGVRASLILAVLHRESLLGKNVGRCAYNATTKYGTTAMNPKDVPVFLEILEKLHIDPSSTIAKISCPNQDGTYGGAMGPAQFIPSTWKLYEAEVAKVTGNNPPSPWSNADAFVATALYLKRFGADSQNAAEEKKAAAVYYCGSNWRRYACSYYANRVVETAQRFQKDIEVISS